MLLKGTKYFPCGCGCECARVCVWGGGGGGGGGERGGEAGCDVGTYCSWELTFAFQELPLSIS